MTFTYATDLLEPDSTYVITVSAIVNKSEGHETQKTFKVKAGCELNYTLISSFILCRLSVTDPDVSKIKFEEISVKPSRDSLEVTMDKTIFHSEVGKIYITLMISEHVSISTIRQFFSSVAIYFQFFLELQSRNLHRKTFIVSTFNREFS